MAADPGAVLPVQRALLECLQYLDAAGFVAHAAALAKACDAVTPGNFDPLVRFVQSHFKPLPGGRDSVLAVLCVRAWFFFGWP